MVLHSDLKTDILVPEWFVPFQFGVLSSAKIMNTTKFLLLTAFCALLGTVLGANTSVAADESDHIYGKGVHAFFDRDYEGAVTILSRAEEIKSNDPRPYYFLGLAYLRQGKTKEAEQYFKQAAQWEYNGRALRDYAVSESLRRIQGEERLRIEKIRSEEQSNAWMREQQLREARYSSDSAADRVATRQLGSQTRQEDLAVLQKIAGVLGDSNAFGVRVMDPNSTTDEIVAVRREENPFGDVTVSASETPVILAPTTPEVRTAVTPGKTESRIFVNPDLTIQEEVQRGGQPVSAVSSTPSIAEGAREAARGIGRGLGSLFSRKPNND